MEVDGADAAVADNFGNTGPEDAGTTRPSGQSQIREDEGGASMAESDQVPAMHEANADSLATPTKSCFKGTRVKHGGKRNRVQFYAYSDVLEIQGLKDFTYKERGRIWYSLEDLDKMRPALSKVNYLIRNCGEDCVRGLEFRTKKGSKKRLSNYVNAGLSVIDEQEFQWTEGIHDPETMATIYANQTKESAKSASVMAILDELYVKRVVYGIPCTDQRYIDAQRSYKWDSLRCCTCYDNALARSGDDGVQNQTTKDGCLGTFLKLCCRAETDKGG